MKINDIIDVVNKAYGDGLIAAYWDYDNSCFKENPNGGDGLAEFIAQELYETFDPKASNKEQINTASKALGRAERQMYNAFMAIDLIEG